MKKIILFLLPLCTFALLACTEKPQYSKTQLPCNEDSFELLERLIGSGDGNGHGPDIGSREWQSTIEFRLKLRDDKELPAHHHPDWCAYILHKAQQQ